MLLYLCIADLPLFESDRYLQVALVGLNKTVMLDAIVKLPPSLPVNTSICDVLSGKCSKPGKAAKTSKDYALTISKCLQQAKAELRNKRMLCVVDLFNYKFDQTEVILNRAFMIPND